MIYMLFKRGRDPPNRAALKITIQKAEPMVFDYGHIDESMLSIGGSQSIILPLYHSKARPFHPKWLQEESNKPHFVLNELGIKVPYWHDAIKMRLPDDLLLSPMQIIYRKDLELSMTFPGDKILIVGYPYGFSTSGLSQSTPVVLTRHVA